MRDGRRLSIVAPAVAGAEGRLLGEALTGMGFTVGPAAADTELAVVLVTPMAPADTGWCRAVALVADARLVPVALDGGLGPLVGAADERLADAVRRLREASWVAYDPAVPETAAAAVAAAARSDLGQHGTAQQLERAAQAWVRSGHDDDALVIVARAARRQADWARDHADDPLLAPSEIARAYVARSTAVARNRMWRTRVRTAVALVSLSAFAFVAWGVAAVARDSARRSNLSIGTLAEPSVQTERSWVSLLAGALLLEGDVVDRDMARQTLRDQLAHLRFRGDLSLDRDTVVAAAPLAGGTELAVVVGGADGDDQVGVYDLDAGELRWAVDLGGQGWSIAVAADGHTAVVGGPSAATIVDLEEREVTPVAGSGPTNLIAVAETGDEALLGTWDGTLTHLDVGRGRVEDVGSFAAVHDVRATDDGGLRALVDEEEGRPALVDGDGRVLASARHPAPVVPQGAVVPDRVAAYVVGADGQLWDLSADGLVPTGLAVPDRSGVALALRGDRVVTGGDVDEPRVRHVPTAADLGEVCPELGYPGVLRPSPDEEVVACTTGHRGTVWALPAGPLADPPEPEEPALEAVSGEVRVRARDNEIRIDIESIDHTTGWSPVTPAPITALAVAPDGPQLVVGATDGSVAVFDWTSPEAPRVVDWHTPDGGAVEAFTWGDDGLVVHTGAGRAWAVPACDLCGSDAGLLEELRDRIPRCWNDRQLQWLTDDDREELDVRACFEVGG